MELETSLNIQGTIIPYKERKSSRSKQLSLRVDYEKVTVVAPKRATAREIREFVKANQDWILAHWKKLLEMQRQIPNRLYQDGEILSVLGQAYKLKILKTDQKMIALRFYHEEKIIEIRLPEGLATEYQTEAIREILEKGLKRKARDVFQTKLKTFSIQMGVSYNSFRLKEQRTRWGSCSSKGNINLNWRVILAPEQIVDYLIIHELAHLKQMNHSSDFWEIVSQYCPDYAVSRQWLRVNGERLRL